MSQKMNGSLDAAALLGKRTAELHLAFASTKHREFKPEPLVQAYQRRIEKLLLREAKSALNTLRLKLRELPLTVQDEAASVLAKQKTIENRLKALLKSPIQVSKIRIHGDYHLGQVLFTGSDFIIIDFEGEPMRSLAERREKRPAFQDLAGMIRSLHYAAFASLLQDETFAKADVKKLLPFAEDWFYQTSRAFLNSYLETVKGAPFVPKSKIERERLLQTFLLSKAIYELSYELNHRPDWVMIPLRGISQLFSDR
jgi:maltose alpha-D-glucosyltransferase/alpha-amylase